MQMAEGMPANSRRLSCVIIAKRLVLWHFWLAFAAFGLALLLGAWQMLVRSPLHPWLQDPEIYYRSVTAHGSAMGYVFPTLVAMGFGYAVSELALKKALIGLRWAWIGFALVVDRHGHGDGARGDGTRLGALHVLSADDRQRVLLPRRGARRGRLVDLGRADVGESALPGSARTPAGPCRSRCSRPLPVPICGGGRRSARRSKSSSRSCRVALGFKSTIDAGLARVFFSWTLHAIVYFWLMPAYIAFYTIIPRAIGGRLYSDTMARISFILFLVVSMPIGIHHLFADPQVGSGFKFLHSVFTALVAVPTLLTVFTICASVEIAARLRGGKGALRLDRRAAVAEPDDARGGVLVRDARLRRRGRHHQHELSARLDDPQHAVDHRAFPPDLRRARS